MKQKHPILKLLCPFLALLLLLQTPISVSAKTFPKSWPQAPEISNETGILMEAATGQVLFDKGMDEVRYPASTTKVMTALLILENIEDLSEVITFTDVITPDLEPGNSTIDAKVGEQLTVEQCLYAIMLASANEVCTQMAVRVAGSVSNFTAMMNERAAELGTQKVISEHSTMGLVVTTDGSVTELPRAAYVPAEARVVAELKNLGNPFAVVLNTQNAASAKTQSLRKTLEEDYAVPVVAMNVEEMEETDIEGLLEQVLGQFPVVQISLQTPEWLSALDEEHWLIQSLMDSLKQSVSGTLRIGETSAFSEALAQNPYMEDAAVRNIDHGSGCISMQMVLKEGLFNQVLAEQCGTEIRSDAHLLSLLRELVAAKKEYDHVAQALKSVRETGYGLVPPQLDELTLQEPEIIGKGGKFGVRLRASAPSLHLIRVDIQTEVSPVVGTERQSEEMLRYFMEGFEQDPQKLWQSNLFGKPLSDLVREGLSNKLMHMPEDTQLKVQQTLEKIINEGNGGMVCILL